MADYSIWVLEYSHIPLFPKSGLVYGAHNEGTLKLPFSYVLIKGQGRVAMVDVGHNNLEYGRVLTERFGIENWHSAGVVLGECGVAPNDVTDVFITMRISTIWEGRISSPAHASISRRRSLRLG